MNFTPCFKRYFSIGLLTLLFFVNHALAGHKIKGMITGFEGKEVILAMMYGGNKYSVDTASVVNGAFTFESIYDLQSGVYLVVLPPTTSFFVLVDQNVTDFSFKGDAKNLNGTLLFEGSTDNNAYYEYLRFFEGKRVYLDQLKKDYDAKTNEADKVELLSKMQKLKKEIVSHQTEVVSQYPGTLTAAMVKCEIPVEVPNFTGSPEEINLKKYKYQKDHFFDNIDLADERLIRAPKNVLVDRVDYYLDVLTPQQPDSIIAGVDYVLHKCEKTQVSYRYFLTHIFNKYRESGKIGMDAIYVHIAENYIAKGKAPWIEEKEKNEVLAAVKLISPTLIGKQAPPFTVQLEDGKDIKLNDIQSPYTVLYFWSPNCTHCQASIPTLNNFYKAYKDKGVQVFAVCVKLNEQEKNCWEYVDKNHLNSWINASDKMGGSSSIHTLYNLKTTPKIYVLDKDKTIVAKDFDAEHLDEVMKRLIQ